MNTQIDDYEQSALDEYWLEQIELRLSKRKSTPHLNLANRIHDREDKLFIKEMTREVWDEPTPLI